MATEAHARIQVLGESLVPHRRSPVTMARFVTPLTPFTPVTPVTPDRRDDTGDGSKTLQDLGE